MKKKVLISVIILLVIGGGLSYFFWNKEVEAKKAEEAEELAYEKKLTMTLSMLDDSTSDAAILASTYQEYWGAIIDGSIPFPKLSNGLGIEVETLKEMTDYSQRSHHRYNVSGLKQGEFNTIISMVSMAKRTDAESILEQHSNITETISDMKNPKEKFQKNYDSIIEIYELYDTFVSLSTAPSGSYIEYSQNINSLYESILSKIATTDVQLN